MVQPMPYAALQQMLDAGNPTGIREYFKVDWLRELPDEAIDVVVEQAEQHAGAVRPADPRADGRGRQPHRQQRPVRSPSPTRRGPTSASTMWMDPAEDDRNIAFTRGFAEAMVPFALGRDAFPNFIPPDEDSSVVREAYGDKYPRLVELKDRWDPENLFRLNQNIPPNGA